MSQTPKVEKYDGLMQQLGYRFNDGALLVLALTHGSFDGHRNNQRLEYLGDAVLEFVVSDYLYHVFDVDEGGLTKIRSNLVREETLFEVAKKLELGKHLLLGKGEIASGGRTRKSINADAVEAVLGAIYLDGGINAAKEFVMKHFADVLKQGYPSEATDYKTMLQHVCGTRFAIDPKYVLIEQSGPAHERHFVCAVSVDGVEYGRGEGSSKRAAEQQAAKMALEALQDK
ncbi:ribonuclease III [Eubacteriales bacterium OttesenSCG-928-N14]|nr:ribonuclease III [Eubacteriales bacterium OttesenSCG-928-N14]